MKYFNLMIYFSTEYIFNTDNHTKERDDQKFAYILMGLFFALMIVYYLLFLYFNNICYVITNNKCDLKC